MGGKVLFTASTRSHILHFHLPYLRALREDGWEVHGAWAGTEDDDWTDRELSLSFEKSMTSPRNFRAAALLRREIRQQGYDAVITHTSLAAFFTRLALLGLRQRPAVINMSHGYLFDDETSVLKRWVLLAAEKLTAPVTDLLLTMNRYDLDIARRCELGTRVEYVPGIGVDFSRLDSRQTEDAAALRKSLNLPDDAFVFIYPAEFSVRKSQKTLLHALAQLPARAILVLPGNGSLLEKCKALAAELGIADRVHFPGYVREIGLWYAMADAAVSSSRSEGLPFNIMEAMYCGLPVAASRVKGHTDLIGDGENGLLGAYDDPDEAAKCMRCLMENASYAAVLAARAQENVQQYALEQVLPQVMEKYRSVISSPAIIKV